MATLYSPPLSSAQWRSTHSLNKQPSADTLSVFRPARPKAPSTPSPPPAKSRFNISSVIRFGMKSKKIRASDIIQDPPEHLYAVSIPVPVSKLQHKSSDMDIDTAPTSTRASRGLSSTSGTSHASTNGPLTPSDEFRVSSYYLHSLMSLSEAANKSTPNTSTRPNPFYANDKRHSANSDKSLGRRIKEKLNDDYKNANVSNGVSDPYARLDNEDKQNVKERNLTTRSSHVRSNVLADMSLDKQPFCAEARDQEKLNTPLISPVSFQHPFVMAEAIPATLLDAHASAHPRKMSDSTYYSSHDSFGTTMSVLSRTPTVLSTSTSRSAPAASGLNFVLPLKSRLMRGSVATYSSGPPLSTQSSLSSLKASAAQQSKLVRTSLGSALRQSASSGSASPRNDSPHPPPKTSLPPTPAELGSDPMQSDTRSPPFSTRRVPSAPAPSVRLSPAAVSSIIDFASPATAKISPENQHLTPASKPIVSTSSTVSLSTISSLSFAVRPSTYAESISGGRSRSVSQSGSVSASIPDRGQEEEVNAAQRENGFASSNKGDGLEEPSSMIDMSEDTEGEEESEIEFGDEEDIIRNNDVFRDPSQRSLDSASKTNFSSEVSGNQGPSKSSSFVRTLTSSTVNALRKQRSFHHSTPSGSSNVLRNSVSSAAASTSPHISSTFSSLSASSPDFNQSNPSSQPHAKPHTRSHLASSNHIRNSHTSSSPFPNSDPTQAQNHVNFNLTRSGQVQFQHQQSHQGQARTLRHQKSFDPGMNGRDASGNGCIDATPASSISSPAVVNNASGVMGITRVVPATFDNVDRFGTIRKGTSLPPILRTDSTHALLSLRQTPVGRSPATSIHSLQLQMQPAEDTGWTSSAIEKRKVYESKCDGSLSTVAEPADDMQHAFPARSGASTVAPRTQAYENDDNVGNAPMRLPSPKMDVAQPILSAEEISRIGEEDTLSYRRRTKSSWGSGTVSVANTYMSADSTTSRYRSPGLIRHAISSSDLYNRANQRDGLLVVVRNEFSDGDPNFTSLPPPPRKTRINGFSNSNGVNSLGMETGKTRERKNSEEKKDREKTRKSSRSKSKSSKSKNDEVGILDDYEPSFLDMGSSRNIILTFEGDKEAVCDGESTIGLPPKLKGSGRRDRDRHDRGTETPTVVHSYINSYRHPYGYTGPAAYAGTFNNFSSTSSPSISPLPSSPSTPPPPLHSPYRPEEDSFLELTRNHDSMILNRDRFVA